MGDRVFLCERDGSLSSAHASHWSPQMPPEPTFCRILPIAERSARNSDQPELKLEALDYTSPNGLRSYHNTPKPCFGSVAVAEERNLAPQHHHDLEERTDSLRLSPPQRHHGDKKSRTRDVPKKSQGIFTVPPARKSSNGYNPTYKWDGKIDPALFGPVGQFFVGPQISCETQTDKWTAELPISPPSPILSPKPLYDDYVEFKKPALPLSRSTSPKSSPTKAILEPTTTQRRKYDSSPNHFAVFNNSIGYTPIRRTSITEAFRSSLAAPLGSVIPYSSRSSSAPRNLALPSVSRKQTTFAPWHDIQYGTDPRALLGKRIIRMFSQADQSCMALLGSRGKYYIATFLCVNHLQNLPTNENPHAWASREGHDNPNPVSFQIDQDLCIDGIDSTCPHGDDMDRIVEVAAGYRTSEPISQDANGRISIETARHRVVGFKTARMRSQGRRMGFLWAERVTPPGLTELRFFDVALVVRTIEPADFWAWMKRMDAVDEAGVDMINVDTEVLDQGAR
ncbi:hypothetical protein K432DRAFT_394475 [Lepidopterella palustris CBS 459.81]|uniref:Uncharacterized protein n=1 Tax=Lepidopterella palustris CBS 459.81 TaxID=1314670 RepID=A0A8E2E7I7_9PEZI|nr:hypothetical protein K432DRAFT_394475 [Lepidopterella palustris CBS 459.81]